MVSSQGVELSRNSHGDSDEDGDPPQVDVDSSSNALPLVGQPTLTPSDARQIAAAMGIDPHELLRLLSTAD